MQRINAITYFSTVALLLFCLIACNDAPTEVGSDFLFDTLSTTLSDDENNSLLTDGYSYLINKPNERNTGRILIGSTEDYKSAAFIRFNVPVNKENLALNKIIECKLHIFPSHYAVGDTNGSNTLSFDVKEIMKHWVADSIGGDDIFSTDNLFAGGRNIADWSGQILRKDTIDDIVLDFSNEICYEWLQKINGGSDIKDTVWGIAIVPRTNSTIINSFKSANNYSTVDNVTYIRVKYYSDSNNTKVDSFDIKTAEEVSFIQSTNTEDVNDLIIQGATRIHSKLKIDISNISNLSSVNYAKLVLSVNEEKTKLGNVNMPDTIAIQYFHPNDTTNFERLTNSWTSIIGIYDSTNKQYIFTNQLNRALSNFVRAYNGKGTLVLTNYSISTEYNQIDKIVFYGLNASEITKRPKFSIVYSAGK